MSHETSQGNNGNAFFNEIGAEAFKYLQENVKRIQDELREKDSKLNDSTFVQENIIESLSNGIYAYTLPDHRVLALNKEGRRIFGITDGMTEETAREKIAAVINTNRDAIMDSVKQLREPGDKAHYIFTTDHNGTPSLISTTSKLLSFPNGQKFILSTMTDETERDLLNKTLHKERRKYRDALIKNSMYFYSFDVNDGYLREEIVFPDGTHLAESMGLTIPVHYDELCATSMQINSAEFTNPEMLQYTTCAGMLKAYRDGVTNTWVEHYFGSRDEYVRTTILLSTDEDTGHVIAFMVANDVTEQRKKELQVQQELQLQYEIAKSFSAMYYASWLLDFAHGDITVLNIPESARVVTKDRQLCSIEQAFENFIEAFVSEQSVETVRSFLDTATITQRVQKQERLTRVYLSKDGEWEQLNLIPLVSDGAVNYNHIILAVQNINAEKTKEETARLALQDAYNTAMKANTAKTEFLSRMSHDIRTPMNAIIGMTALAGVHLDDPERVQNCLSKITVASKHLLGLINEVLDMSKIESGRIDLQVEAFALPDLLDTIMTITKPQVKAKNQEFSITVNTITHDRVIGDAQRLQQVLMNLLSNAIKYTPPKGNIRLTIEEKPTNKPNLGCYEFVVEDTGIGMTKEFLARLFEPFARAEDERVSKTEGTGLGMSITRNIVQMMNGTINVESELNKGSKFTVSVILELQDDNDTRSYDEFINLPILVADDDPFDVENACHILTELGMSTDSASDGKEAVEKVVAHHNENNDYYAVILDWKMPGMDGLATTKAIREKVGDDIPIIIFSAYDWSEIEDEARAAGANAFISKPLFKGRVAELFHRILGHREYNEKSTFSLEDFASNTFGGKRVLLVEDNEINLEISTEILKMANLIVETAVNGQEAVDRMTQVPDGYYDLIFMDIQMPVLDGYEATRAIRRMDREYPRRVPIVAMTANSFSEDVISAKKAGMNEHIAKPLDLEKLYQTLKHWL